MNIAAIRLWVLLVACALVPALQGCASLAERDKKPSDYIPASADGALARLVPADLPRDGTSAFRPLPFSQFAMDARLTLAQHAQKSLDIQYYLLQDDSTGRAFLRAVRDAALRGVRVRILVDDLYTAANDALLQGIAAYPNVEVRLFNPFPAGRPFTITRWGLSLLDFARLNHRMHNKLFIADSAFAIAGGRNIADEYFFRSMRGNFIDFDLLIAGDAVAELAYVFDYYWNSRRVYTLDALEPDSHNAQKHRDEFERLTSGTASLFTPMKPDEKDLLGYRPLSTDIERPPLKMLRGHIRVMADDPEKVSGRAEKGDDATTVTSQVIEEIGKAKEDVLMTSPYFVPGKAAFAKLGAARARGVSMTLVTNTMASNDEPFVSAAYEKYRPEMLRMGVQIYEISPRILAKDMQLSEPLGSTVGRLHAKILVLDRRTTLVGSMNFDLRSSRENTELGLLVDSPELAADVEELVGALRAVGTYRMRLSPTGQAVQWIDDQPDGEIVYDFEPEITWSTRLQVWFLSPFVADSLL